MRTRRRSSTPERGGRVSRCDSMPRRRRRFCRGRCRHRRDRALRGADPHGRGEPPWAGRDAAGLAHLRAMVGDFERARDDYRRGRAILEEARPAFRCLDHLDRLGPGGVARRRPSPPKRNCARTTRRWMRWASGTRSSIAGLLAEALYRQDAARAPLTMRLRRRSQRRPLLAVPVAGIRGKLLARDGAHARITSRRPASPKHGRPTTSKGRAMR